MWADTLQGSGQLLKLEWLASSVPTTRPTPSETHRPDTGITHAVTDKGGCGHVDTVSAVLPPSHETNEIAHQNKLEVLFI